MKIQILLIFICSIVFSILSCSNPMKKLVQKEYGNNFELPPNYVFIPSGKLNLSPTESISMNGFFMSKYEISNIAYAEFLAALHRDGRTEDLDAARVKKENWNLIAKYGSPYMENYHSHPAYEAYPVVNVSREGAEMYCEWLTQLLQKRYSNLEIMVRLPTETEWMYAARGGHQYAPYPWGGFYLRNAKGQFLANFKRLDSGHISYDRKNDKYEVMDNYGYPNHHSMSSPVKSFIPNDYGLFHMSGNVAEMISENAPKGGYRTKGGCYDSTGWDIRIDGPDEFEGWTDPNPYIGFRPIISVKKKN